MAFHFVRGIECWRPTEDELRLLGKEKLSGHVGSTSELDRSKALVKPNMLLKDGAKWLHAGLVEFDALSHVDALFNKINGEFGFAANSNLQDKDSDLTKGFESIENAGFKIKATPLRKEQ